MTEPVLEARDLRIHYRTRRGPVRAVDGVSFSIREGETFGVGGETGCGKSTLGKAILGILPDSTTVSGELRLRGENLLEAGEGRLRELRGGDLALIFQDPMTRLDPLMTIEDHFIETIRSHERVPADEARARALRVLAGMGIPETRFRNYPHEFSGGMRQRIMIAMALVMNPKVLIADEPTTALDVIVEAQILDILRVLRENYRMSLMLITHNLGIVAESTDRVAVMYAGKFAEVGLVRDVFKRPIHPYTQGLLASVIHMESTRLSSIDGLPPDLLSPPTGCRFHPRCVYAKEICSAEEPPLLPYRPDQVAACHFGRDFV